MYKLYSYFTKDGSVGLFSPEDDDIYHSTYGAASEAYEKFIFPANIIDFLLTHDSIKILDICFGIGYNSKSFLNYFLNLKNEISKKNFANLTKILSPYNDKIHTNNILPDITNNYTIYSDNISEENLIKLNERLNNYKVYIKAIDTDKVLAYLSPFFVSDRTEPPKNYKLPFKNDKISKFLSNQKCKQNSKTGNSINSADSDISLKISESLIKYPVELNIILLDKIIRSNPDILENNDIAELISSKKYRQYFNGYICRLLDFYKSRECNYTPLRRIKAFLHNIYYNHLSKRYKRALNEPLYKNFDFDLKINDARSELLEDNNKYNFVFLDAFTPAKCPCLWTVDFFRLIFDHLEADGMILTYSNSAAIRNAFIEAGFCIGKIFNPVENKFTGTIAVKNKTLIKHELSEYDLGLLKTKSGITYRDENLNGQNEAIIARHTEEVNSSTLISSSKYIKQHKSKI